MHKISAVAVAAVAGLSAVASADLTFQFADPVNGRQLTNTQNNIAGPGTGQITYDQNAQINFLVDGSTEPAPFAASFGNARMEMDLVIGTAVAVAPGLFSAPVSGFFRIWDFTSGQTILRGDATGGSFIRFGGTSSILFSDITGFQYTFGAPLQALLNPGRGPINPQEGTFTITDVLTNPAGGGLIGPGGVIRSFSANSSFSGNSAVPTPGALALMGLGGLVVGRRRR